MLSAGGKTLAQYFAAALFRGQIFAVNAATLTGWYSSACSISAVCGGLGNMARGVLGHLIPQKPLLPSHFSQIR